MPVLLIHAYEQIAAPVSIMIFPLAVRRPEYVSIQRSGQNIGVEIESIQCTVRNPGILKRHVAFIALDEDYELKHVSSALAGR